MAQCRPYAILALLLASLAAETVTAQVKSEEYTRSVESAVLEFDCGNWAEARVLFEHAHALRPSARTLRGMGKASFELKEYTRAQRELNASLNEQRSPLSEVQRQELNALLLRVEKFIGVLKLNVKPKGVRAKITIDGARANHELDLNLGSHRLHIEADGYQSLDHKLAVEGGKTQHLELTLRPIPRDNAEEPPPRQTRLDPARQPLDPSQPSDQPRGGVLQQWWFWTIVGVVLVAGGATAVALTAQFVPEPPAPGNTGLSAQVLTLAP